MAARQSMARISRVAHDQTPHGTVPPSSGYRDIATVSVLLFARSRVRENAAGPNRSRATTTTTARQSVSCGRELQLPRARARGVGKPRPPGVSQRPTREPQQLWPENYNYQVDADTPQRDHPSGGGRCVAAPLCWFGCGKIVRASVAHLRRCATGFSKAWVLRQERGVLRCAGHRPTSAAAARSVGVLEYWSRLAHELGYVATCSAQRKKTGRRCPRKGLRHTLMACL